MLGSKNTLAINFSDHSLEAVELAMEKGTYSVKAYGRKLLDVGVIEDAKIIQPDKLKAALQELLAQAKPEAITLREVAITLPESKIFTEILTLPRSLDRRQVPAAVFSQAKETIPLDVDVMAADYTPVGHNKDFVEYLFAATYSALVDEYVEFFRSLQMKVTLLSMESLALGAAVIDSKEAAVVMTIDIGARTTIASVFVNGVLRESININIAGNNITAALAEKLKINLAEAEEQKIRRGLGSDGGDGSTMLVIQGQLQPLKDELAVFIKYFESKSGQSIQRLVLAGGTSSLIGLAEYLSSNLGLPIVQAQAISKFHIDPQQISMPKFLMVIGLAKLALDPVGGVINFLSHREKSWATSRRLIKGDSMPRSTSKAVPRRLLLVLGLVLAAAIFLLILWRSGKIGWFKMLTPVLTPLESSVVDVRVAPFGLGSDIAAENVSFFFTVATDADKAKDGDLLAVVQTVGLSNDSVYNQATEDLVRREFKLRTGREATDEEARVELENYLVDQMWAGNVDSYTEELKSANRLPLPTYRSKLVTVSGETFSTDVPGGKILKVKASYDIVILSDRQAFEQREKEVVDVLLADKPYWKVSRKYYTYDSEDPNGRFRVVATYQVTPANQ